MRSWSRQSLSKHGGRLHAFLRGFFLSALLLAIAPIADAEILPFKHYTTSDGLAHDRVGRVVRDSRGFLWLCTAEGLSRFDGYQFKNYTQENGLPHRSIHDLLETRDGLYWVATSSGLVLFNPPRSPKTAPATSGSGFTLAACCVIAVVAFKCLPERTAYRQVLFAIFYR